jgi:hypothetical protein
MSLSQLGSIESDLEAVSLRSNGSLPANFAREQLQTYRIELSLLVFGALSAVAVFNRSG